MHLTKCSAGDFHFARKSVDRRIRLSGRRLTHILELESILVVELRVLNSPDLVNGDTAVAESNRVVT